MGSPVSVTGSWPYPSPSNIVGVGLDSSNDAVLGYLLPTGGGGDSPAWQLTVRVRQADGQLTSPQAISAADVNVVDGSARLAVNATGDAALSWVQDVDGSGWQVMTRTRSPAGVLGSIKSIVKLPMAPGSPAALVGIDSAGDALTGWTIANPDGSTRVKVRALYANGTLGSTQTVFGGSTVNGTLVDMKMGLDGSAVIMGMYGPPPSGGTSKYWFAVRGLTATGVLSSVQRVSGYSVIGIPVGGIGLDGSNNAVLGWLEEPTTPDPTHDTETVDTLTRSAAGTLGLTTTLAKSPYVGVPPPMDVAVNSYGDTAFLYYADPNCFCNYAGSAYYIQMMPAGAPPSSPRDAQVASVTLDNRWGLAIDGNGNALPAYCAFNNTSRGVFVDSIDTSANITTYYQLTWYQSNSPTTTCGVQIAESPSGSAVAVFERLLHDHWTVQVSVRP